MIEIDHGNDLVTRYAHASRVHVKQGRPGQARPEDCRSGHHRPFHGPHLHFEVLVQGVPQDPQKFLLAGRPAGAQLVQATPGCRQVAQPPRRRPAQVKSALAVRAVRLALGSSPISNQIKGIARCPAAQPGRQGGTAFMATNFLTKIFGSRNDRLLKQYRKTVERINAMEPAIRESSATTSCAPRPRSSSERVAKGETLDACCPKPLPWCAKAPSAS
jgi:hypothetical protein